ncbi:MAG: hypothetical protein FWG21_03365 [Oscillospiraceae bacterium]|nr:hypothetical protein [Oscillospiraceae bacterium]
MKEYSFKSSKQLKLGCSLLYWWSTINLFLSSLILLSVVTGLANSPLLSMVFEKEEVEQLSFVTIKALNCLTILYNSYAVAMSIMVWFVVKNALLAKQRWAFWALAISIAIAEVFAFVASSPLQHTRWQVNMVLSLLYILGMTLSGIALTKQKTEQSP